jgi:hypothetical protein
LSIRPKFALLSFLILIAFIAVGGFFPCFGVHNEGDASSAIADAEREVLRCYGAAAEAERAGANVSDLLTVLNEAGWLLSRAKLAYSQRDFDSAFDYANDCKMHLDGFGFVERAEGLKRNAEEAGKRDFMVNFVGSGVGALGIVVGGFVFWNFLKRREGKDGRNLN